MEKLQNLYALIVGINDYQMQVVLEEKIYFPKLYGCIQDAKKIGKYLEHESLFNHHIEYLMNEQATKNNIVAAFINHLGQAVKGDTVLFYFSGHGAQEQADMDVWTFEKDSLLECIACYYDEYTKDDFLLADKELRFLIKKLADKGAHVVLLFDCCHSGSNTRRNILVGGNVAEKRIPFVFKMRPWDQFIFSEFYTKKMLLELTVSKALPEGLHVQIAACESDEAAIEFNGEGVFTKALIATLVAAKGNITYHNLHSRIKQYLKNVYDQRPKIYVVGGELNLLYSSFLKQEFLGVSSAFNDVLFNERNGWQLGIGAIDGVNGNIGTIKIFDSENVDKEYEGRLVEIQPDISKLHIENSNLLNKLKVYKGYVENLLNNNLRIKVNNINGSSQAQFALMAELTNKSNNFIVLEENNCQYVVNNSNGKFFITTPNDIYRPLTQIITANNDGAQTIAIFLKHIARWEFLKNLSNKNKKINGDEIAVSIYSLENGEKQLLPINNGGVLIKFQEEAGRWKTNIEMSLTNISNTTLYCAVLCLTYNFGSINDLLPETVLRLKPRESELLVYKNKPTIPFTLDEEVFWFNINEQVEYLKLIISEEEFNVSSLSLKGLPKVEIPSNKNRSTYTIKGIGSDGWRLADDEEGNQSNLVSWGIKTIKLQQLNQHFNYIDLILIETMLNDEDAAYFAVGIYFDKLNDDDKQSKYRLKKSICLKKGTKESKKNYLTALANQWALQNNNNG